MREVWLKLLVGDFLARQIAFFSGMALILIVVFCAGQVLSQQTHPAGQIVEPS